VGKPQHNASKTCGFDYSAATTAHSSSSPSISKSMMQQQRQLTALQCTLVTLAAAPAAAAAAAAAMPHLSSRHAPNSRQVSCSQRKQLHMLLQALVGNG
jgi:hypothetical protein